MTGAPCEGPGHVTGYYNSNMLYTYMSIYDINYMYYTPVLYHYT
jgi:hypothetical protein